MNKSNPDESSSPDTPPSDHERDDDGEQPVVFEFAIPAEDFALSTALGEFPDVAIEFEQLLPTNHSPLPFFWATDGSTPAFQQTVAAGPNVDHVYQAATYEEGALYGVEWTPDTTGLLDWSLHNHRRVAILEAHRQETEWVLKIRFPTRERFLDFRAVCDERDLDLRVIRLYDLTAPKLGEYSISEKQREALIRALSMGHFEIPREATLEDVAESLGISARATSERLRRGQTNLVSNTLTIGHPSGVGLDEV